DAVASVMAPAAKSATREAAPPKKSQPDAGAQFMTPITSAAKPVNKIPTPTPANTQPDHVERRWAASTANAHAETPTRTNALATPANNRSTSQTQKNAVNAIAKVETATAMRPSLAPMAGRGLSARYSHEPSR